MDKGSSLGACGRLNREIYEVTSKPRRGADIKMHVILKNESTGSLGCHLPSQCCRVLGSDRLANCVGV